MIDIQIGCKSPSPHTTLRYCVHHRIKEFHKTYGTTALSIISDSATTSPQLTKITGSSATNFCLHDYFAEFMSNSFNVIRHIHIKTGDRKAALGTHVRPDRRTQAHPAFFDHLYEGFSKLGFV